MKKNKYLVVITRIDFGGKMFQVKVEINIKKWKI